MKLRKRFFAVLLTLCLLAACLPIGAAAAYETSYGAELTGAAAEYYAALFDYYVTKGGVGEFEGTVPYSDETIRSFDAAFSTAFAALNYDRPDVFWFGNYGFGTSLQYDYSTIRYHAVPNVIYEGADGAAAIAAFNAGVDAAVASIRTAAGAGAARRDLLKAIHDYLCQRVSYGANGKRSWSAEPAFVGDTLGVCECYSRAFKVLCDRFEIPCAIVSGTATTSGGSSENHMWNYVKMETGRWYLVDVTWDDQSFSTRYEYFLVGAGSRGFYDTVSRERTEQPTLAGGMEPLAYPQLSETSYDADVKAGVAPAVPETPETPETPGEELKCRRSNQQLVVDGVPVEAEVYNIDDLNYFRLRDIAALLTGTGSQFDVQYNQDLRAIILSPGTSYVKQDGDLEIGEDKSDTAVASTQHVRMGGGLVSELTKIYNIGGNNYFQLRELGGLLGFAVGYDPATRTMTITTAAA